MLGIVQSNGSISFLGEEKNLINDEFVQIAKKGRNPEKRFRFADTCMKKQCKQWNQNRCGVIDKVMEVLNPNHASYSIPICSIRLECRWYKQHGNSACMACPYVITDMDD